MTNGHKNSGKQIISYASFCLGNLGHAAFYGVMSTYFIIFITSGMFSGLEQSVADKLIGLITGLMETTVPINGQKKHGLKTLRSLKRQI